MPTTLFPKKRNYVDQVPFIDRIEVARFLTSFCETTSIKDAAVHFGTSHQYIKFAKCLSRRRRPQQPYLCPAYIIKRILTIKRNDERHPA